MADDWEEETSASPTEVIKPDQNPERGRACLTVIAGNEAGQTFKLPRGVFVIGRAAEAEIRIGDEGISRKHARIRHDSQQNLFLDDLDSRNGTFVNGERVERPTPLREGDKIQIGRTTVFRFAFQDALDESFHENLVLRDPLTKLFNKRYLLDRLDRELKFARRHKTSIAVLMLDLDHFKAINDTHGHLGGDAVLATLSDALLKAVRNEDVVARFGGEEIAIILRAVGIDQATHLAERVRRLIEQTVTHHQGRALHATVSIGVAAYPHTPARTVAELIEVADQNLYRAKRDGRNRVVR